MISLNPVINQLHAAFCHATGRETVLIPQIERWWYEALKCEVTPQMVTDVIESRMKRDYSTGSMRFNCLGLRHLIGDDDRLAQFVDEAAQIAATKRKRVFVPGKAQVLRDTGRPDEPETPKTRHVSEVDWKSAVDTMRKAT